MSRVLRLHHPGSAFHICSRTQGHHHWFTDDLKDDVADILLRSAAAAGARPMAFAVMDNHFHLVLLQGSAGLGWTMQPALRRIALMVQRKHKVVGHVFERRFRAKLCHDSEYLPNAILYVHRNPVDAGICKTATDYRWSSAAHYEGRNPPGLLAIEAGLRAFCADNGTTVEDARHVYLQRLAGYRVSDFEDYWDWLFRALRKRATTVVPLSPHRDRAGLRDIRDVARGLMQTLAPHVEPEFMRSRYGGKEVVAARRNVIAALIQRGYLNIQIAEYMRVSESLVSRVRSQLRWANIEHMRV